MSEQKYIGALSGIKVIDLTRVLSGPFCTMLLADMGAEVIKIEPPKGDNVRNQGDMVDGYSSYFAQFNRNKKSVILNLYVEAEKDILKSLLSDADVVVENFKAGVFDKMGFDYDTLKSINPKLISASVNGFGSKGEMSDRPAFDFIAQALSGFMSLNGTEESGPMRAAMPISDLVAGLYCAFGIVCALQSRNKTGKGQKVEASLTSGLISMMAYLSSESFVTGKAPNKSGNNHPILAPYGIFKTSDGEIAVAPASDKFCCIFLECIDLISLLDNELYKNNSNKYVLIIGDMLELGSNSYTYHKKIIPFLKKLNPKTLFTIGNISKILSDNLKNNFVCRHFRNIKLLEVNFDKLVHNNDIVFVKGSNGTGLYKFCKDLEKKYELGE